LNDLIISYIVFPVFSISIQNFFSAFQYMSSGFTTSELYIV